MIGFFGFNGISIFVDYLMPKQSLYKNSSGTIFPIAVEIRRFIPFPRGISLKVNEIAQLGFESAYYDDAVQHCGDLSPVNDYQRITNDPLRFTKSFRI